VLVWVQQGVISLAFDAANEIERLLALQRPYRNLPMDFADACLMHMTEIHEHSSVLTTDSHFRIYRRNGRAGATSLQRSFMPLVAQTLAFSLETSEFGLPSRQ
jgi:hypothetical protein